MTILLRSDEMKLTLTVAETSRDCSLQMTELYHRMVCTGDQYAVEDDSYSLIPQHNTFRNEGAMKTSEALIYSLHILMLRYTFWSTP
jgi:hypothetical protein